MRFIGKIINVSFKFNIRHFHKVVLREEEQISLSNEIIRNHSNINFNIHNNEKK